MILRSLIATTKILEFPCYGCTIAISVFCGAARGEQNLTGHVTLHRRRCTTGFLRRRYLAYWPDGIFQVHLFSGLRQGEVGGRLGSFVIGTR